MKAKLLCCAAMVAGLASPAAGSDPLSLIDLGAGVSVRGINVNGQATGCMPVASGAMHAFLYSGGVITDLGTLGGANSCGDGINASGQITGYAATATSDGHAFIYSAGLMTDLGALPGTATSEGTSINAGGDVVGNSPMGMHAFLYSHGVMTDLFPTLDVDQYSRAVASGINDSGEIAGTLEAAQCGILCPVSQAFVITKGVLALLPNLPAFDGEVFDTTAAGINDTGQIVAYGEDPSGFFHGVIYTNGSPADLGNNTLALAINATGNAVGTQPERFYKLSADALPFIFSGGVKRDLNLPGATPLGINDSGWIITNHSALNHAYILQPSTISLMPFGLLFGNVVLGQSSSATSAVCSPCQVTLTNNSASAVELTPATATPPFTQTNNCGDSLAPGASCLIKVSFTPSQPDATAGALIIGAGGTHYATLLGGVGAIEAHLTASTASAVVNETFTLTWSATTGSTCQASGDQFDGPVPVSGSKSFSKPTVGDFTFSLNCTLGGQSANDQVVVKIKAQSSSGGSGAIDFVSLGTWLGLWGLQTLRRLRRVA